jgi:hypothetical protein
MNINCNIEFAHVTLNNKGEFNAEELRLSCSIAARLCDQLSNQGLSFVTSVLVDDEEFDQAADSDLVSNLLEQANRSLKIDYVCWESRLHRFSDQLLDLIATEKRANIAKKINRYIARHGHIACSHNIAIWQMIRLGAIPYVGSDMIFPLQSTGAHSSNRTMPGADLAISVLSGFTNYMRVSEDIAEKDILSYVSDNSYLARIKRIYFDKSGGVQPELKVFLQEILR